jgi:hypothetical protein
MHNIISPTLKFFSVDHYHSFGVGVQTFLPLLHLVINLPMFRFKVMFV